MDWQSFATRVVVVGYSVVPVWRTKIRVNCLVSLSAADRPHQPVYLKSLKTRVDVIWKKKAIFPGDKLHFFQSKSQVFVEFLKEDDVVEPILFLPVVVDLLIFANVSSEMFGFFWQLFNSTTCISSYSKGDFVILLNIIFGLLTSCLYSNIYSFIRHTSDISSKERRTSRWRGCAPTFKWIKWIICIVCFKVLVWQKMVRW